MPDSTLSFPSCLKRLRTFSASRRAASFMPDSAIFWAKRWASVTFSGCISSSSFWRCSICRLMAASRIICWCSFCWEDTASLVIRPTSRKS